MKKLLGLFLAILLLGGCLGLDVKITHVTEEKEPQIVKEESFDDLLELAEGAGGKWSDYGELAAANIVDGDDFLVRDVSDTSLAATGTQKRLSWSSMKTDLGSAGFYENADDLVIGSGGDPADSGTIRLKNADSIQFEASPAGTDVNALSVDSSEVVQIASSGASGVTITPATAITGALTLASELLLDELGIEGQPTDTITDCSSFSATGGGIFYDDSEGVWKKCQDNVLTVLDTTGGTPATADISDVSVTQTELAELETIGATVIEAADWTAVAAMSGVNTGDEASASVTVAGIAELATGAETVTGTDTARAVTPDGLTDRMAAPGAIGGTTPAAISGTTGTFTGTLSGELGISLDTTATVDLSTASNARGAMRINNDNDVIDYTLPPAEAGLNICFYSRYAAVVTIDVDDGVDVIILDGTALTAGYAIDSPGTAGDFICLMCIDATYWLTLGRSGTWIDGGAD